MKKETYQEASTILVEIRDLQHKIDFAEKAIIKEGNAFTNLTQDYAVKFCWGGHDNALEDMVTKLSEKVDKLTKEYLSEYIAKTEDLIKHKQEEFELL